MAPTRWSPTARHVRPRTMPTASVSPAWGSSVASTVESSRSASSRTHRWDRYSEPIRGARPCRRSRPAWCHGSGIRPDATMLPPRRNGTCPRQGNGCGPGLVTWDRPWTTVRSRGGSIEDAASFHEEEGGSQPTPPLQTQTGARLAGPTRPAAPCRRGWRPSGSSWRRRPRGDTRFRTRQPERLGSTATRCGHSVGDSGTEGGPSAVMWPRNVNASAPPV